MTKEKPKMISTGHKLVINGISIKGQVKEYHLEDGVWTFYMDDDTVIVATGSVIFCSDGNLR